MQTHIDLLQYSVLMQLMSALVQFFLECIVNKMLHFLSFKHTTTLFQYSIQMQVINSFLELYLKCVVNNYTVRFRGNVPLDS